MLAVEGCLNPMASRTARQVLVGTSLNGMVGAVMWAQGLLQGQVSELGWQRPGGGQMRSSCWVRLAPDPLWDTLWGSGGTQCIMHLWAKPSLLKAVSCCHCLPSPGILLKLWNWESCAEKKAKALPLDSRQDVVYKIKGEEGISPSTSFLAPFQWLQEKCKEPSGSQSKSRLCLDLLCDIGKVNSPL